jgi:hypothetical protein
LILNIDKLSEREESNLPTELTKKSRFFQTVILHHFIILMLKHMAVPHKTAIGSIEAERRSIIFTELNPKYSNHSWRCIRDISENFFFLPRQYIRASPVGFWANGFRCILVSAHWWFASIR